MYICIYVCIFTYINTHNLHANKLRYVHMYTCKELEECVYAKQKEKGGWNALNTQTHKQASTSSSCTLHCFKRLKQHRITDADTHPHVHKMCGE